MRAIALAFLLLAAGCASSAYRTRTVARVRNGDDRGEAAELFRTAPWAEGLEPGDCAALYRSTMSAVDFLSVASPATVEIVEPVSSTDADVARPDSDAGLSSGGADAETEGAGLERDTADAGSATSADAGGRAAATERGSGKSSTNAASTAASRDSGSGSASSATSSNAADSNAAGSGSTSAGGSSDSSEDAGSSASASETASRDSAADQGSRDASSADGSESSDAAEAGSESDADSSSLEGVSHGAGGEGILAKTRTDGDAADATTESRVEIARFDAHADVPLLVITKSAYPSTAFYGDEVVFRIRIRNDSRLEIEKILVVDHLDGWFEFEDLDEGDEVEVASAPGGGTLLVFEVPELLMPGETWTTMVTVSVRSPARGN